ncbi:MAG TPA: hypothetical protein VKB76_02490, partial [Ktedonobacterales bacterium]|nr:hypothetical protein [Ktedonobacterales bacterium]
TGWTFGIDAQADRRFAGASEGREREAQQCHPHAAPAPGPAHAQRAYPSCRRRIVLAYERAGMHALCQNVVMEKELRPAADQEDEARIDTMQV